MRKHINLDSNIMETLVTMSEGNPVAATVLGRMINMSAGDPTAFICILHLDDMNMRGPRIWVAYKDYCKQDMQVFLEKIKTRDVDMVNAVNAICASQEPTDLAVTSGASFKH